MTTPSPGSPHFARGLQVLVVFALAVTVVLAVVGPYVFWQYYAYDTGANARWFRDTLPVVAIAALTVALVPRLGPSRWLGATLALPAVHVVIMIAAWIGWSRLGPSMAGFRASRLLETVPVWMAVELVSLGLVVAAGLVSRAAGRPRPGDFAHALVMVSLSALLLLGLWLPIASALWCAVYGVSHDWRVSGWLIGLVLAPPGVAAVWFALAATRWPARIAAQRARLWGGVAVLLLVAVVCRIACSDARLIVYSNFLHFVLAAGFTSVVALLWLGLELALRGRRAARILSDPRTLRGEVLPGADGDAVLGQLELTSWLRGPRVSVRGFQLRIPGGVVDVPRGEWASLLSAATMALETGARQPVLRAGDPVIVAGMQVADGAHPFRGGSRWIAGTGGIWIGTPIVNRRVRDHVALALWRPCAAYLMILIAIAVPALVAAR